MRDLRHTDMFTGSRSVAVLLPYRSCPHGPAIPETAGPQRPGDAQWLPAQVAPLEKRRVSAQISLIGTMTTVAESPFAAKISVIAVPYPIK